MRRIVLFDRFEKYRQKMYLREITITNNETSDLSDFQIPIEIGGDFLDKANPNNLILTIDDEIVPYWVEQWKCPLGKAKIWTKSDLTASSSETINLYYGGFWDNLPNGDNVFNFFDDFSSSSLKDDWTYDNDGTMTLSDSFVKFQTGTTQGTSPSIYRNCSESLPLIVELRKYVSNWGSADDRGATFYMEDSGANNAFNFTLFRAANGDYRIVNKSSGTWNSQITLASGLKTNTIYKLRTIFNNTDIIVQLLNDNDLQIASHTFSSFSFTPSLMRLETWNNGSTTNCIGLFDWVLIRKYTANEPSISIGSEQVIVRAW